MISKKNIRYEGVLYSINETNSTLALQNVKSFGTEGRENTDPSIAFVAPQEGIHAYLLFRGCDIKDLHVHEQQEEDSSSSPANTKSEIQPAAASETGTAPETIEKSDKNSDTTDNDLPSPPAVPTKATAAATKKESQPNGNAKKERSASGTAATTTNNNTSQRRSNNSRRNPAAVGTGASLLNRKARGAVQGGACLFMTTWY